METELPKRNKPETTPGAKTNSPLKDLSILLVDDSQDYTAMMSKRLQAAGARVETAHDGQKSLDLTQSKEFDVILMDIQMPGLDGLKVIELMRAQGVRTPIITVTALKDIVKLNPQHTKEIAAHAGKPTDLPDLIETVQGVLAIRDL